MQRSGLWCGRQGQIETFYLGSNESNKKFVIYDKQAEIKKKQKRDIPKTTRIEFKDKTGYLRQALINMSNPFSNLRIEDARHLRETHFTDVRRIQLLDSCRQRGKQAALALYSQSSSRRTAEAFLQGIAPASWWDPEEIWQSWLSQRSKLRRFFEYRIRPRQRNENT